jgi:mediator of RNA polymerase II transcription subunit 12
MGRMLMQESTSQSASDCLDQLTANIFHHSMTSEEAYFVAEMARGVDGAVAGKVSDLNNTVDIRTLIILQFINNGLQCMSEMLRNTSLQLADLNDCIQRAGQLLRVLAHIAESMREEAALLPQLESTVQDEFIDVLSAKFDAIKSALEADREADIGTETSHISQSLIFLARLLQFDLGFQGAWTSKTKGASNHLISILFRLALVSAAHSTDYDIYLLARCTDPWFRKAHRSCNISSHR